MYIDPVKILKRSWHILWSYRALWVFGLILALAAGGSSGNSNSSSRYEQNQKHTTWQPTPENMQEAFKDAQSEMHKIFEQGIPDMDISGKDLTTFLWVIGAFVLVMILLGIVMAVARYVSETAVIRMVDEYEATGNKMTVREGFRIGWSPSAWRLFLINLIVNLPMIALMVTLLFAGLGLYFAWMNGTANFAAFSTVTTVVLAVITIFVVVILSIVLGLLRNFFWRISVLEDTGVRESFQRGFTLVRENWKNVGLMWLVMIGLGIVWAVVLIILVVVSIPVLIVTAVLAVLVSALPYLLFVGIFSTFLSSWLPWVAGFLFVAPLFFTIAFSPWALLGSWQQVYNSIVWTLTYREIKAVPAITATEVPPAS
ncbi:MAG: hypothetical protein IPP66_06700 [Anaerolineales bacterium]|nr:hypothetical protein [Anaerolineales bacterium]